MIYILLLAIMSFLIYKMKNSAKDSLSCKVYYLIVEELPLIIIILIVYIMYSYNDIITVHNKLSFKVVNIYFWDKVSNMYNIVFEIISKTINSLLNPDVLKIFITLIFIKRFILTPDMLDKIKELASNIKELSYKDIIVKLTEANKHQDEEIEEIKGKKEEGLIKEKEAEEAIDKIIKKKEYTALLIDNPLIAEYLYSFILEKSSCITIPINIIPRKVKVYDLQRFFTYESNRNSIKITGLNKENEALIVEIFNALFNEDIICNTDT